MSFSDDEEILEDFLIEAGEILEQLSEQLVGLERQPDDTDLLNAIFRGFHTIKGGAGFLQLTPLVDCCHLTENLFDMLRTGQRTVNAELMDVVLQVVDSVKGMFAQVREHEEPMPADPALLAAVRALVSGEASAAKVADSHVDVTDDEFEQMLFALDRAPASQPVVAPSDEITDEEFEALLDTLHGKSSKPVLSVIPGGVTEPKQDLREMPPETTVRVDTRRLDEIMNMVGELVLVRNRLVRIGAASANEVLSKAIGNLDLVTADLQMSVMKTRMQPIKKVFGRFPRVVRDLARSLGKEVALELHGEDTDLDKNLVEALADPLVHLVRNAVDHGIEQPDVRERTGKQRTGTILLAAEQEGDHILLSISDDGNGMDPEVLRRKAVEKGIMDADAAERLSDSECFNLIFAPGFSTKSEISDVSGRGVGMDVVKTRIAQLNGSVHISSRLGQGSRIEIKVPLTLAIMPTLMVMVGDQAFALPLTSVNEIFHLDLQRTNMVDGQQVVTVRDKSLPLFHLRHWLLHDNAVSRRQAPVVIVAVGTQRIGFVVDDLIGQEEVVIKPLGKILHGTPGIAGATITGDGRIALILDVPGLLKRHAG